MREPSAIQLGMDIEQLPPNKPNFGLIVALFCATLLILFVFAYFFVRIEGNHLVFRHHNSEPHSQLLIKPPTVA